MAGSVDTVEPKACVEFNLEQNGVNRLVRNGYIQATLELIRQLSTETLIGI